jgi:hypothetical protein
MATFLENCSKCLHNDAVCGLCEHALAVSAARDSRAVAQAVSRWLPTALARARAQVRSCGICGGRTRTGLDLGFLASSHATDCPTPIVVHHPGLVQ